MRGEHNQQQDQFSYGSLEKRVPENHPLRPIRVMVDEALLALSPRFDQIYDADGRKSILPERLLRALLLQLPEQRAIAELSSRDEVLDQVVCC